MINRFGREDAYTAGYRVFTTVDSELQHASRQSLRKALTAYDRRHGYRGAEQSFTEIADWILTNLTQITEQPITVSEEDVNDPEAEIETS